MPHKNYTPEELHNLKEAVALLEKYKFSLIFGDIAGALQKVIDVIEISLGNDGGKTDFVAPEKVPHIKGSEYLAPIIEAVRKQQVLRLYYHPFYEDKPYFTEVHPYLLKEYENRWYMVGLNDFKRQTRTYSLDRIRDIQVSDVNYIAKDFNAESYFKHTIGVISPPGTPPRIVVEVQKTQAQYMITRPWHESQNIEEEKEDSIVFSLRVHPTYELVSLLLSFGKDLRVLSPDSLRERIRDHVNAMTGYYTE